ncbi:MAG: hypothetical protein EBT18_04395 [Gammaproteobacteria bacterium]|nr:hypothetical protein [Gammaproteobacteria bacterium]
MAMSIIAAEKARQVIVSTAFAIAISLPASSWLFSGSIDISETEGRRLAALPEIPLDERLLKEFPNKFENYFDDHYGFRSTLIESNRAWKAFVFKKSFTRRVIRGSDDWLFFNDRGSLADFIGQKRLSVEELRAWEQYLLDKKTWLNSMGIEYLFVPIPNKMTVYPEHLPTRIKGSQKESRLDQLEALLNAGSLFGDHLFLKEVLVREKESGPKLLENYLGNQREPVGDLYLHSDTHWTSLGGFIAYRQIIKRLQKMLPGLEPPLSISDQRVESVLATKTDLARILSIPSKEIHHALWPKASCWDGKRRFVKSFEGTEAFQRKKRERGRAAIPFKSVCAQRRFKAVIAHDSFGNRIRSFFGESFGEAVFMGDFDLIGMEQFLREYKPDVFVDLRIERLVPGLLVSDEKLRGAALQVRNRP